MIEYLRHTRQLFQLLCVGLTLGGFFLLLNSTVSTAETAVDTVSVFWDDSLDQSLNQPVNITSIGLPIKYSVGGMDPGTFTCTPDKESINQKSVTLKGSDGKNHPAYTVSFTEESSSQNYFKFTLSILLPHYELTQNTQYKLLLNGGVSNDLSALRFKCSKQPNSFQYFYLPTGQHTLEFSTGPDTIRPTILEKSELVSLNSAVVAWKSSEDVSPLIYYGTSPSRLIKSVAAKKYGLWYVAEIKNLSPGTRYAYKIEAKDQGKNVPSTGNTGTITTWRVSPITVSDRTGHEVTVKWTTDVATDSIIEYGTTPRLGQRSGSHQPTKSHNIRLGNLKSNQKYYAQISITRGDATARSKQFTFSTLDASGGFSTEDIVVDPEFISQFDFSRFNFMDFPLEELQASDSGQEATSGAVLASTDSPLESIAGNFNSMKETYPWLIWLWVPILLLLTLIAVVLMLLRHERKLKKLNLRK